MQFEGLTSSVGHNAENLGGTASSVTRSRKSTLKKIIGSGFAKSTVKKLKNADAWIRDGDEKKKGKNIFGGSMHSTYDMLRRDKSFLRRRRSDSGVAPTFTRQHHFETLAKALQICDLHQSPESDAPQFLSENEVDDAKSNISSNYSDSGDDDVSGLSLKESSVDIGTEERKLLEDLLGCAAPFKTLNENDRSILLPSDPRKLQKKEIPGKKPWNDGCRKLMAEDRRGRVSISMKVDKDEKPLEMEQSVSSGHPMKIYNEEPMKIASISRYDCVGQRSLFSTCA